MINQYLGDHATESHKSPYFWKLQIAYWAAYTLLQGIAGCLLIAAGIILSGSEWLLLEWILLKSAFGFLVTTSLRPLFTQIHSKMWHPLRVSILLLGISLSYTAVEILLTTQIPFLREHFSPLTATLSIGTSVMVLGFYMDLFFLALWIGFYFSGSLFFDSVELIRRQNDSELALLRNQMQPHFLFNALTRLITELCAKNKLLCNFHDGPVHPYGQMRTWPNAVTREFCFAQLDAKRVFEPKTFVSSVFINMLAGPLDMNNGFFDLRQGKTTRVDNPMECPSTLAAEAARTLITFSGPPLFPTFRNSIRNIPSCSSSSPASNNRGVKAKLYQASSTSTSSWTASPPRAPGSSVPPPTRKPANSM